MYPHQSERLTHALARAELETVVASSPGNISYITGFKSLAAAIHHAQQFAVFSPGGTALVVPAPEASAIVADGVGVDHVVTYGQLGAAFAEPPGAEARRIRAVVAAPAADPVDGLATALTLLGVGHGAFGLDESGLTHDAWRAVAERLTAHKPLAAVAHLAASRRVKGPYELDCLGHALRIAEEALDVVVQAIDRGMTEREAAVLYAGEVVKRGAWPFPPMVATGERAWLPAPWPSDRALRPGDLVRFDVGCAHKGYCGSVARTAVLGEPAARAETAYLALQAGLAAAMEAVAPGADPGRVFALAVEAVRAGGCAGYERADVGHGIGLDARERPTLAPGHARPLEAGEVLQLDLPYYEIGSLGLAVRDTLLVTTTGSRTLNSSRHDLIVLD